MKHCNKAYVNHIDHVMGEMDRINPVLSDLEAMRNALLSEECECPDCCEERELRINVSHSPKAPSGLLGRIKRRWFGH